MNNKILVTGASGYIGSLLCEKLLNEGHEVYALDNLRYSQQSLFNLCHHKKFNFIKGDARDQKLITEVMKKVDIIFPLACLVGAPLCDKAPKEAQEVNSDAIRYICENKSKSQKIIYPTTNSGYGTKTSDIHCDETTPLEPISIYGTTKVEAEKIVLSTENTVAFRLATVFGMSPRMRLDLLVNDFVYRAVKEKYLVLYEKGFKRNYIHIRDVIDCFDYTINNFNKMQGEVYNLGLDEANLNKEELALEIKKKIPDLNIISSEFNSDIDKRNYIVSNEKLIKQGFKAQRSIQDGIEELIKGYQMFRRNEFYNI